MQCVRVSVRGCAGSPLRRLLRDAAVHGEAVPTHPALQWATQPYAAQRDPPEPLSTPPQETAVLLFPGQGSQRVGMGRALQHLPAAMQLYELASSVVGWDVWRVCTEGPEEELARRCQACVLVTALGALERLRDERPAALERVRAAAGFSLGEIVALVFAGALPLEGALRLVELRAAAMSAAARTRPSGMLTVWLAPDADLPRAMAAARAAAGRPDAVCCVANYLYPGCKVVAGDEAALAYLEQHGRAAGVKRAARVRVEGAFHTELMAEAATAVRAALHSLEVRAPLLPVYSAVDARRYTTADHVRRQLTRHVTRAVRWEQTLQALFSRPRGAAFPLTVALGPGGALRSTLRQVNARAWDCSLQVEV